MLLLNLMSSLVSCFRGSNFGLEDDTRLDRRKHPKKASNMAHQHAKCFTLEKSRTLWNLIKCSTQNGSFWRTGLESCALRPFRATETRIASKTLVEGGVQHTGEPFQTSKEVGDSFVSIGASPQKSDESEENPQVDGEVRHSKISGESYVWS